MGNEKILKKDEFFELIAVEAGKNATPASAKKYYDAMYNVILRQLELNGKILLENFVTIEITQTKGYKVKLHDLSSGEMVDRWVKPKIKVIYRTSGVFERAINDNDFKPIVIKHRKKRWNCKADQREYANARRRKPKEELTMEQGFLKILNQMNREEKDNGET